MHRPLVSILIVTWNRRSELGRAIESAKAQTYPNIEVVVVDNHSRDGTAEFVRESYPEVTLVCAPSNLGCPSGRNFGFQHCRGEYIYMLDDDGWLEPTAIAVSVVRAEADPEIGVVMSRIHESENGKVVRKRPEALDQSLFVATFSGGCSLFRREALSRAGLFPDDFFRQAEENDLALRLLENRYFCFLEPASIMYHAPSPVGRSSKAFIFYNLRNGNRTGLRLWPFPWCLIKPMISLGHAIRYAFSLKYFALPFQIVLNACIDGIKTLPGKRQRISVQTFHIFKSLSSAPSKVKPSFTLVNSAK